MSDVVSIFLILIVFYLVECVKFAPLGAYALISPIYRKGQWREQQACMQLMGARKCVFIAPLLPWPQIQLITAVVNESAHKACAVKGVQAVEQKLEDLKQQTSWLRHCSLLVFLNYFLLMPLLYHRYGEGSFLYSAVGLGYVYQALTALAYRSVHAKLFPKERNTRWLHGCYNLLLPWHAMRAADELFLKSSMQWSQLALLTALIGSEQPRARLTLHWRQTKHLNNASYRRDTLLPFLQRAKITPESAEAAPESHNGAKFCPCCHGSYEQSAETCADCKDVKLLS